MMYRCGHELQLVDKIKIRTLPDGRTEHVRIQQKMRVRGPNAAYCTECNQVVDEQDKPSHGE